MTAQRAGDQDHTSELRGFDDFEVRLGDVMRGERATLGKSLLDVQRELKIKATYIAAIENAEPEAFETPGFIAGYVRSYARYLGLDAEWAYQKFCEEGNFQTAHGMSEEASGRRKTRRGADAATVVTGPRDPFTEPSVSFVPDQKKSYTSFEPRALGSVFVLLLLVCGLGYGGWSVLQEVQKVRLTPVDQSPAVVADISTFDEASSTFAGAPSAGEVGGTTVEAFDRLYRPQALDVPVLVARDGPIGTLDPAEVGTLAPGQSESVEAARLPPVPDASPYGGFTGLPDGLGTITGPDAVPTEAEIVQVVEPSTPEVVLFAVRPSWVRVRGADGSVIFEKILDAGEEYRVPLTETPPSLRAGNAQSVFFRVNGVTLGPAGDNTSVVRNVALGPTELGETYTEADLSRDADLARFVDLSTSTAR